MTMLDDRLATVPTLEEALKALDSPEAVADRRKRALARAKDLKGDARGRVIWSAGTVALDRALAPLRTANRWPDKAELREPKSRPAAASIAGVRAVPGAFAGRRMEHLFRSRPFGSRENLGGLCKPGHSHRVHSGKRRVPVCRPVEGADRRATRHRARRHLHNRDRQALGEPRRRPVPAAASSRLGDGRHIASGGPGRRVLPSDGQVRPATPATTDAPKPRREAANDLAR